MFKFQTVKLVEMTIHATGKILLWASCEGRKRSSNWCDEI